MNNASIPGIIVRNDKWPTLLSRVAYFGQHQTIPQYRTAVFLQFQDAIALRDLLSRNLKDIEDALAEAEGADESPPRNVRSSQDGP